MLELIFSYVYFLLGCSDANIIQPQSMMLEEGQDARLECRQDYGHHNMLWFRQHKQHQDLQLLYNFYNGNILQKNPSLHRLNADQPILDRCLLNISVVKPEDSAVYFCASSETTEHQNTIFFLQKSSPFVFNLWIWCSYKDTLVFSTRLCYVMISAKLINWTQADEGWITTWIILRDWRSYNGQVVITYIAKLNFVIMSLRKSKLSLEMYHESNWE